MAEMGEIEEALHDELLQYLEDTGVLELMEEIYTVLLTNIECMDDPLDYILSRLKCKKPNMMEIDQLKQELDSLLLKEHNLKEEKTKLKILLQAIKTDEDFAKFLPSPGSEDEDENSYEEYNDNDVEVEINVQEADTTCDPSKTNV